MLDSRVIDTAARRTAGSEALAHHGIDHGLKGHLDQRGSLGGLVRRHRVDDSIAKPSPGCCAWT